MKILFLSLGCDKNLVDSEVMLGMLTSRGYEITDDENEADIIVINTCCFIHDAMEESIQNILDMAEYKKNGKAKALIVAGCLAQRYRQEILDEIPEKGDLAFSWQLDRQRYDKFTGKTAVLCLFSLLYGVPELFPVFPFRRSHRRKKDFLIGQTVFPRIIVLDSVVVIVHTAAA